MNSTPARIFELLFAAPDADGKLVFPGRRLFALLEGLLKQNTLSQASAPDYLNALAREYHGKDIGKLLLQELFECIIKCGILPQDLQDPDNAAAQFYLKKARILFKGLKEISDTVKDSDQLLPGADRIFAALPEKENELPATLLQCDPFGSSRVFRWVNGKLHPATVQSAKDTDSFFGFQGVRTIFNDHFRDFAKGKSNIPLLVYSLPGYGKTSMTISYVLENPENILILPEPEALEDAWDDLIAAISCRPDHKFVIFFDDIDPREVNWYSFRTHVGGAFSLPGNIMPVLSSNYEFPASILSRGRKVSYPVFDELRCTEMIEDFLLDFGLRSLPPNLVALIGADYTEEFGQKKFTELSPRTLIRYLSIYARDPNKRRTIAELAMSPLITRPDAELFYSFNINLMRSLYGDEYIARMREEKLRSL